MLICCILPTWPLCVKIKTPIDRLQRRLRKLHARAAGCTQAVVSRMSLSRLTLCTVSVICVPAEAQAVQGLPTGDIPMCPLLRRLRLLSWSAYACRQDAQGEDFEVHTLGVQARNTCQGGHACLCKQWEGLRDHLLCGAQRRSGYKTSRKLRNSRLKTKLNFWRGFSYCSYWKSRSKDPRARA